MIENLIASAVRLRIFICILFVLVIVSGVAALKQLPIDAFPDLVNNQVQIFSEAEGMGPEETEQLVTIPLESALLGLPDVTQVRSLSKYGLSVVTVVFGDGTSTYFARQLVFERLQSARGRLPRGIEPALGPVSTAMGEIFQYVLRGDNLDDRDLKTINEWDVKYRLRAVPGVADVNVWGGRTREFHVTAYPTRLLQYNLTLKNLSDAIERNNDNFGAGIIDSGSEQSIVRGLGRVLTEEDIAKTVVANRGGVPITVHDLAEVSISSPTRQGAVTKDGKGEVVTGIVMMLKGENSREVIGRVKQQIKTVQNSLPQGVRIEPFYDQTELVEQTVETVRTNLLEGALLVVVVLLLMLGNIQAALMVALVIPISLMFSFIGMRSMGISANIMSLGAIDFGMIVDGSIVMMENIVRRLSHTNDTKISRLQLIQDCAREMSRPILFGIIIITIVYLPILSLQGMEYKMFSPMVFAVCFALIGSLLTALLLIPALSTLIFRGPVREYQNFLVKAAQRPYSALLKHCMKHKVAVIVLSGAMFVLSAGSLAFIGTEFVPTLDEGDFVIQSRMPTGISLPESIRLSCILEREVMKSPEVTSVESRIGRPDLATDPMGVYQADVFVLLKPKNQWRAGLSKEALSDELRARLKRTVPGTTFNFTQPIAMRVDELVSGVKAQLALKIFGDDVNVLHEKALQVEKVLATVDGVTDLQAEKVFGAPQILIVPERQKLARYGVDVEQVRMVSQTAIMGSPVSEVIDGRKRFTIRLRTAGTGLSDPEDIGKLLLEAADGRHIPLSQVATVERGMGMEALYREGGQRRIIVQCNVKGRDIGSFVKEAQEKIDRSVKLPSGYYVTWGGQFENQERAMERLSIVVPVSIAAIFALLTVMFGSFRLAAIVLLNVPFALIGGLMALWVRGMYLSVPATIGFIALFGVAVLNGIVLVASISHNALTMPIAEAIEEAAKTRLRPVLMTATVATLGFLPMAISHGAGAEVQKPLATVVIGGLLTSTLLTLLVLPVVYALVISSKSEPPRDKHQ